MREPISNKLRFDMTKTSPNQISKHFELDYNIRGSYLVQAIAIESIISDIIGHYFCQNNNRFGHFVGIIMNKSGITLASKIKILGKILQYNHPKQYKKYAKLMKQLKNVNEFRNLLAHSSSSYSQKFLSKKLDDRIVLAYYKDGKRVERIITKKDIEEKTTEFADIIDRLIEILSIVNTDKRPTKY